MIVQYVLVQAIMTKFKRLGYGRVYEHKGYIEI